MSEKITDKTGKPIHVGDTVVTKIRGGKRVGEVESIINSKGVTEGTEDVNVAVKNPPKVVYTDQHGHQVSHNPGTLNHGKEPVNK